MKRVSMTLGFIKESGMCLFQYPTISLLMLRCLIFGNPKTIAKTQKLLFAEKQRLLQLKETRTALSNLTLGVAMIIICALLLAWTSLDLFFTLTS